MISPQSVQSVEILLVEDNLGDILLAQEAFKEGEVSITLHVVRDGEEAISFLKKEDSYSDVPRPDLILLDLNLPKKDGSEVLIEVKTDPDLKRIPVIVLTTSEADEDILKAYDLNANSYLAKPVDIDDFIAVVQGLEQFWFTLVKLPPK